MRVCGVKRLLALNQMNEFRLEAYTNAKLYKERTKLWYGKHILAQSFKSSHQILLYNSRPRFIPEKLKFRWSRPFIKCQVFPHGVIEIKDENSGV